MSVTFESAEQFHTLIEMVETIEWICIWMNSAAHLDYFDERLNGRVDNLQLCWHNPKSGQIILSENLWSPKKSSSLIFDIYVSEQIIWIFHRVSFDILWVCILIKVPH